MTTKHPQHKILKAIADDRELAHRVQILTDGEWKPIKSMRLLDAPVQIYRLKPREFK